MKRIFFGAIILAMTVASPALAWDWGAGAFGGVGGSGSISGAGGFSATQQFGSSTATATNQSFGQAESGFSYGMGNNMLGAMAASGSMSNAATTANGNGFSSAASGGAGFGATALGGVGGFAFGGN